MYKEHVRRAGEKDILAIVELEKQCFTAPWSEESIRRDIIENDLSTYILCELQGQPVGYAGIWFISGEGHINNVCVAPGYRGMGFGEDLVKTLIEIAKDQGIFDLTLEVRPSNLPAIKLYEKAGFQFVGTRPKYYLDNGEDAMIMWRKGNE